MPIRFEYETTAALPRYVDVSIAFMVESKFLIEPTDHGWSLNEVPVENPYLNDYDELESPMRWSRWDTSNWRVISAYSGIRRVGGAIVAWKTPDVEFLEGRDDIAALWDIRVAPECRGQGIGSALFKRAAQYAKSRRCAQLKIETQDINVRACQFYAKQGCKLAEVNPSAYPKLPLEVQLIWRLDL